LSWRPLAAGAGIAAVLVAPWLLWRTAHGVSNVDLVSFRDSMDPAYLWKEHYRLTRAIERLGIELANQSNWLFIVPGFTALAIWGLVGRVTRRAALFYLVTAVLIFASLSWAYWVSRLDITFHLESSARRVITSVVLVAAVGAAHLLVLALTRDEPRRRPD
jgi:hypothetical protein